MYNFSATPTFIHASFSGNAAGSDGGAMANLSGATPTVINSIFWGNGSEILDHATSRTSQYFTIEKRGAVSVTLGNSNTDPSLGTYAKDTNAAVGTFPITSTSNAHNTGAYLRAGTGNKLEYSADNTTWTTLDIVLPQEAIEYLSQDARGKSRTDRPDMGSYEVQ